MTHSQNLTSKIGKNSQFSPFFPYFSISPLGQGGKWFPSLFPIFKNTGLKREPSVSSKTEFRLLKAGNPLPKGKKVGVGEK
jgi:hypothetical protein